MSAIRRAVLRLLNALRPESGEADLARQVAAHLTLLEDDFRRQGMTLEQARRAARLALGGVEQTKERHRAARSLVWLDDARRDVRYAIRSLGRVPGFTAVAVLTLALGIGASTAIFSIVSAVLLRPLPFKDAGRLVRLYENVPGSEAPNGKPRRIGGISVRELIELRARSRTLSNVAAYGMALVSPAGSADTTLLAGAPVSAGTLPMLGVQPELGRWFLSDEERAGGAVIVLSHQAWKRYFAGDPAAIGKSLTFTGNTLFTGGVALGVPYTVVGVMPAGFHFPADNQQFWVPLVLASSADGRPRRTAMIARLADGTSTEAAAAEVSAILHAVRGDPPAPAGNTPARFELVGAQDEVTTPIKPALLVLTVAVAFVLLIACANVASLLLARSAARRREIAVRIALGAGRMRVVRQMLTESVVLALLGAVAGTALAWAGVHAFRVLATTISRFDVGSAAAFPRLDEIRVDAPVFWFALLVSVIAGLLFGLAPAAAVVRGGHLENLRAGTASSDTFAIGKGRRTQSALVVAEIAIATTLFVGGGLLMRSFVKLASVAPGYDAAHVLTFQVALRGDRYPAVQMKTFADDVIVRLRSVRGIDAAAYARQLPFVDLEDHFALRKTPEAAAAPNAAQPPSPDARFISRDYLRTMGIRVIAGRGFDERDRAAHPRVMVINETLARRDFPGENPVGRKVYAGPDPAPWAIVGVVADVHQFGLDRDPQPQFFADVDEWRGGNLFPIGPYYAVRLSRSRAAVANSVRAIVRQIDPEAAIYNIAAMDQLVANSMSLPRLYAALLGIFAAVAVGLAAIGIYGLMAYAVTQRTREIGIRMALGARRAEVLSLILRQSGALTLAGMALGLAGAAAGTRFLAGLLFGLTPLDPATYVGVAAAFALVATLAAYLPARRAASVDPSIALRCE